MLYIAAKTLLVYKNGLADILHIKEDEENINPINYNIILNFPEKFKELVSASEKEKEKEIRKQEVSLNLSSLDPHQLFEYITSKANKVNLKELAAKKVSFSPIALDYNYQDKDAEISEFLGFSHDDQWYLIFQNNLKKSFEYIDSKSKKFYEYVIKLHSYSMRVELDAYYSSDKVDLKFKTNFKEFYTALIFKYNLLVISRIYNFISGVTLKFEYFNEHQIDLKIFTDEITYLKVADFFNYSLQLKPYAHKYALLESKCVLYADEIQRKKQTGINSPVTAGEKKSNESISIRTKPAGIEREMERELLDKNLENELEKNQYSKKQSEDFFNLIDNEFNNFKISDKVTETNEEFRKFRIEDFDINNHLFFPPYLTCTDKYYTKYRTYDLKNDDFLDNEENNDFISLAENHKENENSGEEDLTSAKKSKAGLFDIKNILKLKKKNQTTENEQRNYIMTEEEKLEIKKKDVIKFFSDVHSPQIYLESSIFRSIDKLRLLSISFDYFFKLKKLKRMGLLSLCYFNRHEEAYIYNDCKKKLLCDSINVFSVSVKNRFLNHMRNTFGEEISFYLLWLQELIRFLVFPAVVGVIAFIIIQSNASLKETDAFSIFDTKIKVIDIIKLILCFTISIWFMVFMNHWKSMEKLYSYVWGCENSDETEPYQETYSDYKEITFVFDWKIKTQKKTIYLVKRLISYLISIILVILVIFVNSFLLYLKKNKLLENPQSKFWAYFPPSVNACLIKVLSFSYRSIANCLSHWENHPKNSIRVSHLSIKIFLFEFVNNFYTYYYIGFIKYYNNECLESNCSKELELQSYISFVITASINFLEIGIPYLMYKLRLSKAHNNANILQSKASSTDSLKAGLDSMSSDSLIEDYIEIILYLAYVILLTTSAALTPLFVFVLILLERGIDSFKIYYFLRVEVLNSSKGISIYNYMIKIILYLGTLTSLGFVLFSGKQNNLNSIRAESLGENSDQLKNILEKLLILLILENVIFLIGSLLKYRDFPECT